MIVSRFMVCLTSLKDVILRNTWGRRYNIMIMSMKFSEERPSGTMSGSAAFKALLKFFKKIARIGDGSTFSLWSNASLLETVCFPTTFQETRSIFITCRMETFGRKGTRNKMYGCLFWMRNFEEIDPSNPVDIMLQR